MTDSVDIHPLEEVQQSSYPLAPPPHSEIYKKYEKRGMAIIFNHKHYDMKIPIRLGTDKDRDDLSATLDFLNFEVNVYNDLSCAEITEVLSRVKDIDHTQHTCLLVTVMSHGEDGKFYARDKTYPIRGLWEPFLKIPSLAGKPKLFFIQACRGTNTDPGIIVSYGSDEYDGKDQYQKLYSIPVTADVLIMYSTFEGYYSYRDPQKGSYFIQSIVHQMKTAEDRNLFSILTDVNREVAINYSDKEMCTIVSTLTRRFYLE